MDIMQAYISQYKTDREIFEKLKSTIDRELCVILAYQKEGQRYKFVEGYDSLEASAGVAHIATSMSPSVKKNSKLGRKPSNSENRK